MDLLGKILARRALERNSKVPKPRRAFTARSYRCRGRGGTGSLPRDPYFSPPPRVETSFKVGLTPSETASKSRRPILPKDRLDDVTERSDHTWRTREILRVRDDWRRETAVRNGTRRSSFVRSLSSRGSAPRLTTGEQQISIALTYIAASFNSLLPRMDGQFERIKFRIESSRMFLQNDFSFYEVGNTCSWLISNDFARKLT